MIDLHSHLLPGIDDGAPDLATSLEMARAFLAGGVTHVACTPHILPGLYHNTGEGIRGAIAALQQELDRHGLPLRLLTGADNHVVPDFVAGLRSGHLLSLADTRYVLVEPPHHTLSPRLEELFFSIQAAGYVPILTHPERLRWINTDYPVMERLAQNGVWMQITAGSVTGAFGKNAQYWAHRMLGEGLVHILASDAHDPRKRPPNLAEGRAAAARLVGDVEAEHLVVTRPRGVVSNVIPTDLPPPGGAVMGQKADRADYGEQERSTGGGVRGLSGRLRRIFQ